MMRKKNSLFIISILISGLFVSCWDNFTERAYYSANITSFGFEKHDTCPNIEFYSFNIDQMTGVIYNADSLPYGRVVNSLYPKMTLQSTNGSLYANDSLWEDGDSLDFTSPVIVKNTSEDGVYTRSYTIHVNVHQVDPDSMVMNLKSNSFPTDAPANKVFRLVSGGFRSFFVSNTKGLTSYVSADGLTWTESNVEGLSGEMVLHSLCVFNSKYFVVSTTGVLYSSADGLTWTEASNGTNIVTLFGQIKRKYINEADSIYLIGLVKNSSGELVSARSANNGLSWTPGSVIDAGFPVSEYAMIKGATATGVQFYTLVSGLKANGEYSSNVWSTENGLDWILIQDGSDKRRAVAPRAGATLFYYDGYLVYFGGVAPDGAYHKEFYVSGDQGRGWSKAPDHWALLNIAQGLSNASVYVEHVPDLVNEKDREYIWIFGGSNKFETSSEIWKGYLNKMVFARR
jgi:Domain of unknown function (DUF6242)